MDTPLPNRHLDPKARAAVADRMAEAQAKFARLTDRLVVDAAETRAVRAEIVACRDWLWPRRRWQREIHWRRPRGCGAPPIPPPLPEADVLSGRSLRTHALAVLLQTGGGELPLPEIHTLLHRRGFAVAGPNPVKRWPMLWATSITRAGPGAPAVVGMRSASSALGAAGRSPNCRPAAAIPGAPSPAPCRRGFEIGRLRRRAL